LLDNERHFRGDLGKKITSTIFGLALLIPEYLRLGVWDLITGWSQSKNIFSRNMAMQMINESALCLNGIRANRSLDYDKKCRNLIDNGQLNI